MFDQHGKNMYYYAIYEETTKKNSKPNFFRSALQETELRTYNNNTDKMIMICEATFP